MVWIYQPSHAWNDLNILQDGDRAALCPSADTKKRGRRRKPGSYAARRARRAERKAENDKQVHPSGRPGEDVPSDEELQELLAQIEAERLNEDGNQDDIEALDAPMRLQEEMDEFC
jgi:hypothetical protein